MAIQTGLESLANLRSTQAGTAATEQSTFEKQQTFPTRKAAGELDLEQAEYTFHELMANRETRDALGKMNMTKASQFTKALEDNPELMAAEMQINVDMQQTELGIKQLNQKYGLIYAYAQGIEEALSNNNPAEATKLAQQLDQEHMTITGKPLDIGVEGMDLSDPNFKITQDWLPSIKSWTKIAGHMSEQGKAKELEEIKVDPYNRMIDMQKDAQGLRKGGLVIDAETMKQAGNALYGLPGSFTEKMELATDGSVMGGYNQTQLSNLKETMARLMAAGNAIGNVQQRIGTDLTVATDQDLPGVAWDDEVNFMHPTDPAFDVAEYRRKIASLAESKNISAQTAADIMTQQMLNKWAGSFSGMVTGQ